MQIFGKWADSNTTTLYLNTLEHENSHWLFAGRSKWAIGSGISNFMLWLENYIGHFYWRVFFIWKTSNIVLLNFRGGGSGRGSRCEVVITTLSDVLSEVMCPWNQVGKHSWYSLTEVGSLRSGIYSPRKLNTHENTA